MLHGVRNCPTCGSRVLPTADDTCPTCRQYKFTGAQVETARVVPDPATLRTAADNLYRGAVIHWRLLKLLGGVLALLLVRFVMHVAGRDVVAAKGVDPDLAKVVVSGGIVAVLLSMLSTALTLADWLGRMNPRGGAPPSINVLSLLKHSMTYFESQNAPVGAFGPRMRDMQEPEVDEP